MSQPKVMHHRIISEDREQKRVHITIWRQTVWYMPMHPLPSPSHRSSHTLSSVTPSRASIAPLTTKLGTILPEWTIHRLSKSKTPTHKSPYSSHTRCPYPPIASTSTSTSTTPSPRNPKPSGQLHPLCPTTPPSLQFSRPSRPNPTPTCTHLPNQSKKLGLAVLSATFARSHVHPSPHQAATATAMGTQASKQTGQSADRRRSLDP